MEPQLPLSPRHCRRRRKSSLLDIQNEIVRRGSGSLEETNNPRCLTRMSWYQDALQQQGVSEADLKALLAAEESSSNDKTGTNDLAEQHKIMAIHHARKLLEASLGHPFVPPKTPCDFMDRPRPVYKPSLVLPKLPHYHQRRTSNPLASLKARQTCLIPPNVPINIAMTEERNPILIDPSDEPDVQMGSVVPDGSVATRGTICVRCHSCPQLLRVSLKATLVKCPTCRELTPASDRPVVMEFSTL